MLHEAKLCYRSGMYITRPIFLIEDGRPTLAILSVVGDETVFSIS